MTSQGAKYLQVTALVFITLAAFTSQFSIASSSIGVGGLILITAASIITRYKSFWPFLRFDKTLVILFAAFILVQVISSALSSGPAESFSNIFRKISIYIVFFASIIFIDSKKKLRILFITLFVFSALVSIVELARFIIDYGAVRQLSEFRLEYFGYPVTNGQIKMLILLAAIPFIISKKDFILNKWLLALLTLPVFITFYLTNARNAVLGLFTGLVIYGILKNRYALGAVILISAGFLLLAPLPLKERILSIGDLSHPSNKARIVMWETGLRIFSDNIIFGTGDTDINKIYRQFKNPEYHGEGSHMHNNLIHILVTLGIAGALIWIALMLYMFILQVKAYLKTRSDEFLNVTALISVISMAAFQAAGLTEWSFGDAEYAAILWFNLALAFIALNLLDKSNGENV